MQCLEVRFRTQLLADDKEGSSTDNVWHCHSSRRCTKQSYLISNSYSKIAFYSCSLNHKSSHDGSNCAVHNHQTMSFLTC